MIVSTWPAKNQRSQWQGANTDESRDLFNETSGDDEGYLKPTGASYKHAIKQKPLLRRGLAMRISRQLPTVFLLHLGEGVVPEAEAAAH
jgi:hypothetical protein